MRGRGEVFETKEGTGDVFEMRGRVVELEGREDVHHRHEERDHKAAFFVSGW